MAPTILLPLQKKHPPSPQRLPPLLPFYCLLSKSQLHPSSTQNPSFLPLVPPSRRPSFFLSIPSTPSLVNYCNVLAVLGWWRGGRGGSWICRASSTLKDTCFRSVRCVAISASGPSSHASIHKAAAEQNQGFYMSSYFFFFFSTLILKVKPSRFKSCFILQHLWLPW